MVIRLTLKRDGRIDGYALACLTCRTRWPKEGWWYSPDNPKLQRILRRHPCRGSKRDA